MFIGLIMEKSSVQMHWVKSKICLQRLQACITIVYQGRIQDALLTGKENKFDKSIRRKLHVGGMGSALPPPPPPSLRSAPVFRTCKFESRDFLDMDKWSIFKSQGL